MGNQVPAVRAAVSPDRGRRYYASIHPGQNTEINQQIVSAVQELQDVLGGIPIWLLVQNGRPQDPFGDIDDFVFRGFRDSCSEIEKNEPVGLLVDSPGGDANDAYRITRFFQRRTSNLTVIVPRRAKSAATLMALGAGKLIMGLDAELGPLDIQMFDPEREEYGSALNAVQSLERLNAFSMSAVDQLMPLLLRRTGRRMDAILPLVLEYVVNFVKPLLEKIDAVDYTKKSRDLKVAEQYAIRLMKSRYRWSKASRVASNLVEKYPTHGFVIDQHEVSSFEKVSESEYFGLGLEVEANTPEIETILGKFVPLLDEETIIGRLKEISDEQ